MSKVAVVQIRGSINAVAAVKNTLETLNLDQKHACVVLDDTAENRGMLAKIKDYVTWGEVSDDTVDALRDVNDGPVFHLQPPTGGFASVKQPVSEGGALGHRDDMDALLERMV